MQKRLRVWLLYTAKRSQFVLRPSYAREMQEEKEEARVRARLRRARELTEEHPSAIWLMEAILEDALSERASDIHIDLGAETLSVRLRVDGQLEKGYSLPRAFHSELISRCKILAGLRIDERLIGQDGRFGFASRRFGTIDARISLLPCYYGQNAVIRLLSSDLRNQPLAELGMKEDQVLRVTEHLQNRRGIILVSGPTGGGKTTTLYALMFLLEQEPLCLVSVEDPVEYAASRIRQVEVRTRDGLGFASALRSVLRQDPDIIMVGEIRDEETARLALQAALTGHLVLASIHGNGCVSTISRLRDLGLEPYLIAETLSLVIAQELVRVRCTECIEFKTPSRSCLCTGSGFLGRTGVFTLLESSPELERAIREGSEHAYA